MAINYYKNALRRYFRAPIVAFFCLGVAGTSDAVTVGNAIVRSYLDQPLLVEIPLTNISPKEQQQLAVGVAPELAFQEFGYEFSPQLRNLRFEVEPLSGSSATLRISTKQPINEPFVAVMLEFKSAHSGFIRGYTLLLDPIEYPTQTTQTRSTALAELAPPPRPQALIAKPAAAASAESTQTAGRYGPVRPGETLSHIADRVRGPFGVGMSRMTWGLYLTNPTAFLNNNAHALKAGVYLNMPAPDTLARISTHEAIAALAAQQTAAYGATASGSAEVSAMAPQLTIPPIADRGATMQVHAPELGFDLAPRLEINSTVSGLAAAIPSDARLSQLLDPTAKVAVATDTAGNDQRPKKSPEESATENESDAARSGARTPPSDRQAVSADVARLEGLVKTLQDQLLTREQQITRLEQKLEAVTASMASAPKSSRSITGSLTPRNVVLGLAVLVAGALLVWLVIRRRAEGTSPRDRGETSALYARAVTPPPVRVEDQEPSFMTSVEERTEERTKEKLDDGRSDDSTDTLHEVDESEQLRETLGLGTEFLIGDLRDSELAMKVSETDVLEELELYINGGYYNDAKNLLARLVDKEPDNTEFRLQLLRVLRILGEGDEFMRQAKLARTVIDDPDGAIWEDIRRMGAEIRPSEPLFADDYFAITDEEETEEDTRDHVVEFKP